MVDRRITGYLCDGCEKVKDFDQLMEVRLDRVGNRAFVCSDSALQCEEFVRRRFGRGKAKTMTRTAPEPVYLG